MRDTPRHRALAVFVVVVCVGFPSILRASVPAGCARDAPRQDAVVQEVVREVRVHGNHTTPDADVLGIAGLAVGTPVSADVLRDAEARLRSSGRFAAVDVRKRFRSISDPSDVLVILLVDEHPGVGPDDLMPGPLKRVARAGMWLPVIDYQEGYGWTYGARVSFVGALGVRSRASVPLTWGGERRAALEVDRTFARGPISRVEGVVSVTRRENPHFDLAETRREARVGVDRHLTPWLRAGASAAMAGVSFAGMDEQHHALGVHMTLDTRRDPAFPRHAVHVTAAWERLDFSRSIDVRTRAGSPGRLELWRAGPLDVHRTRLDARGYLGLVGSSVLALRAVTRRADAPLPPYEQALLGGSSLLRGYRFGYRAGDNLAAASAELRVPLTSPLNAARFGVKAFADVGTVYRDGSRLADQAFDRGIGAGLFLTATVFRAGFDLAWPRSGKPRGHFALGLSF